MRVELILSTYGVDVLPLALSWRRAIRDERFELPINAPKALVLPDYTNLCFGPNVSPYWLDDS